MGWFLGPLLRPMRLADRIQGLARHLGTEPPDRGLGRIGFDERSTDEVSEDASLRLRRNDTIDDCGFFEQFLAR